MVNKLILLGRLGQDPETKTSKAGKSYTKFSIATDSHSKGESKTEWHRCTAFGRTAEIIQEFSKKGDLLYVEGSIHTDKWTDKEGNTRYSTGVNVYTMQFVSKKDGAQQSGKPGAVAKNNETFDEEIPF
tara:strand:- start:2150 stop:2536 length:387 start_codon:yes stop_codon:yes gene_type:complete